MFELAFPFAFAFACLRVWGDDELGLMVVRASDKHSTPTFPNRESPHPIMGVDWTTLTPPSTPLQNKALVEYTEVVVSPPHKYHG